MEMIDRIANNIYTAYWATNVVAGNSLISTNIIRNPMRYMKVRSVTIDWKLKDPAANVILPFQNTTTQELAIAIEPTTGTKMARMLIPVGGTAPSNTGDYLFFTFPGQFLFESFYFTNDIIISLVASNHEAATAINHYVTLTIETIEKMM